MKFDKNTLGLRYVEAWENEEGTSGLQISWICNLGLGTLDIIIDTDGNICIDDEHMSKEFVMAVFEKMYDKAKGIE